MWVGRLISCCRKGISRPGMTPMAHEDKCRHGMPPNMCGHCKRPAGDRYELRPGGYYRGYPMVEILKNGGPVHRYYSHFKFGAERARLLLVGRSVIDQF